MRIVFWAVVVSCAATRSDRGTSDISIYGRIVFGEYQLDKQEVTARVQRICDEMRSAGIDVANHART